MVDLRTRYMGLDLRAPLVASASPLTGNLEDLRRLEAAGAGAVVLPSLFQEQLTEQGQALEQIAGGPVSGRSSQQSLSRLRSYNTGPEGYLTLVEQARQALSIPVIASLNAVDTGSWVEYAPLLEEAGAGGLVLFNRFYQPDIDPETLQVAPTLTLSTSEELRLPLRWIGILHGQLPTSLAATSGVHTGLDAVKALLAGADVAMTASALLRGGPGQLGRMLAQLRQWLEGHGHQSVSRIRGLASHHALRDTAVYERANCIRTLITAADQGGFS